MSSSPRRLASSLSVLVLLSIALVLSPIASASPLAATLIHQALLAGPNQGNPEPQRTPSTPIGTLPGTFTVDDRGAARFSIPLELPPAARGMEPALSLEYDSQLGSASLGVGWSLGGRSAISRCAHSLADDGEVAPVKMTDEDALCLDGERLVLVDGSPMSVGATYRPKRDDFTRIHVIAGSAETPHACHGGFGFMAERRDGTIATYGCRRDATVGTHLGPRTWALAQVRDRFGNYVDYRYTYEIEPVVTSQGQILGSADVEHYLASVDYGAHFELHEPTRQVRLDWELRPDPWEGWFLGARQRQSKRLAQVSTYAPTGLVHRYELDYDTPSITGRSLLQAVRQCDAEGVCRPETSFEWELGELAVEQVDTDSNFSYRGAWPFMDLDGDVNLASPQALVQTVLDANGDGRTDMLLAVGQSGYPLPEGRGWELWTSQPHAAGSQGTMCGSAQDSFEACAALGRYVVHESPRSASIPNLTYDDPGLAVPPMFAMDYNGDGRDDAAALGDAQQLFYGAPPAGTRLLIAESLAEGGVDQHEFDPEVGMIWWFAAVDQTGDGFGDLLFCAGEPQVDPDDEPVTGTGTWHFARNVPGEGFSAAEVMDTGESCSVFDKFLIMDHDGDGLSSLLVIPVWDAQAQSWIPSAEWGSYQALRLDPLDDWAPIYEDTGLPPDLAQRWRGGIAGNYNSDPGWLEDDFPRSLQGFGLDRILDVNGDGLPDVLRYELALGDTADEVEKIKLTVASKEPPLEEWGGVRLWVNTGAGFRDGGWMLEADAPGDYFFRRFLASGAIDYDGDGRLDYLTPVDDPNGYDWLWSIWTSDGDGSFTEHPEVFDYPIADFSHTTRSSGAFDLDGDGLHDIGVLSSKIWGLFEHAGAVPDKLVAIENGLGARIEVDYGSLTDVDADAELFVPELDACPFPQRCERDPRVVVERHELDSGITDQPREFEHRYRVARGDRLGARSLGFREHEIVEWTEVEGQRVPIYRRRIAYNQSYDEELRDYPFTGQAASILEEHRDPLGGRHRLTVIGRSFDVLPTSAASYTTYVAQEVTRVYELGACPKTFCDPNFDLDPDDLVTGSVDTVYELDTFANPTHWTRSVDTGPTIVTYHHFASYQNDPEAWLLGLPTATRTVFVESGVEQREREWRASYYPTGAMKAQIVEPTDPELYLHESYTYDDHGNRVSSVAVDADAELRGGTLVFDKQGVFPVESNNALGHTTTLRWDPGLGVPIEARDPNDLRLVADYDGLGHVTGLRSFVGDAPEGVETTFFYEALAALGDGPVLEIRSETPGHGHHATRYDRLGRSVSERALDLDGLERYIETRYDQLGRRRATSLPTIWGQDPIGWELLDHDFADRLTQRTLPDGTSESWTHFGTQIEHVDISGTTSIERHDTAGRLVESVRAVGSPDEERLCFDYGAFEQLVAVRPDCMSPTGPAELLAPGEAPPTLKSFLYDDLGRMIASHDPAQGLRNYFYNGHGELEAMVDGKGDEVSFTRDALGRVTARSDVDGETSWIWDTQLLGYLSASVSPAGHEELRSYDAFGRLEGLTKVVAGESFELGFTYDEYSRLAEVHYPIADLQAPFWIRNHYAANGDLIAVRDPLDELLWRVDEIDDAGRVTAETFGNGAETTRSYDPLRDFVRDIETSSNFGGALQDLHFEWSPDGTLHQREDQLHGQHEQMAYDDLRRLIEVDTHKGPLSHTRHFAYDSLGNLVYASDRGAYDYDGLGRLAVADGGGYEWDDNGNLIARTGSSPIALSYTAFDKPATIDTDTGELVFEYDAEHERVYRYSDAEDRETIYVTELYQRHHDGQGGEVQHHYYVPGLERMVATVVDRESFSGTKRSAHYIHVDHIGSTEVVSDESGLVEQRMSFDAWGKRRDPSNWTAPEDFAELGSVNLGFTGHEAQDDAGLINLGGRMYDPHLGRMTSADPFIPDPMSTQGWNRYAYVLNRPLTLTDPSGFMPKKRPGERGKEKVGGEASGHPGGDEGVLGRGESKPAPDHTKVGGSSKPKPKPGSGETDHADQQTGDSGPTADASTGAGGNPPRGPTYGDVLVSLVSGGINDALRGGLGRLGPAQVGRHPLEGFTDAMVPDENPSQERRRRAVSDEVGDRVSETMINPPDHVVVSIELTLFFIGGDAELVMSATTVVRQVGKKGAGKVTAAAARRKAKREARKEARRGRRGKKRGPKPWPHGPHNRTIERRIDELEAKGHEHINGGNLPEEVVDIPPGGRKTKRRPDITTVAPDGTVHRENVGRATRGGRPVARERRALDDLEHATGTRPTFTPYNN